MASVELAGVGKLYSTTRAVDDASLKIPDGSYCCLLGPSGCGKTSTLRMIASHESISEGDVRIGDRVVTTSSSESANRRRPHSWPARV